jgi:hypothetical protein
MFSSLEFFRETGRVPLHSPITENVVFLEQIYQFYEHTLFHYMMVLCFFFNKLGLKTKKDS